MKKPLLKLKNWVKTHRRLSLILGGSLAIIIVAGLATIIWQTTRPEPIDQSPIAVKPRVEPKHYSPLTGKKVKDEAATKLATTAIMIENSPDARPQSGLKDAGVVYEAVAEGGITRFLAIYQQDRPNLIGPVRSLREYYVDWLTPYNASVVHVGGSSRALQIVRTSKYRDIDQFHYPQIYWRVSDRYAPHNVYTSFKQINVLNKQKNYTKSNFKAFERTDGKPSKNPSATRPVINFSSGAYNTFYTYSKSKNTYTRHQGGSAHKDREKGAIAPSVIIAMRVNMTAVNQDGYREQIKTTGSGQATIFQNGTAINATWRKKSRDAPLELLDKDGKPVKLVRGQTWIAAVPNGRGSVSW